MSETMDATVTGRLQVMDATGHSEITWHKDNPAEVRTAKDMFEAMQSKGHNIFEVNSRNQQGKRATSFDPAVEKYMVVPQLVGG